MQRSVSIAKLAHPRSHVAHPRERLFALLDDFRNHPVRWISAPPGAGKTTLAASWLESRQAASCWYRIDERDTDPASLFYYLGEAERQITGSEERRLPLFTPEYTQGLPAFAHRFFEQFFAGLPRPFVLVIDDYHEIPANSLSHAALMHGLEELPAEVGVVVLSRKEPPPDFARLQVASALERVAPAALRLDAGEVQEVLRLHGVSSPDRIRSITERAAGWAAGIQLLLESGDAPHEAAAVPTEIGFDYFAGEIFRKLPETERRVLLCAALLPACTASLAQKLSGDGGAGAVLERFYRRNYFVTRDAESADPMYRFHPLFHDFLAAEVKEAMPEEQQAWLQLSAAAHLEQQGKIDDAIFLRLAAHDAEGAASVIARVAGEILRQGRHRTLTAWTEQLPEEAFNTNPWLLYWKAMARLPFDPGEVLPWLQQAFQRFDGIGDVAGIYLSWAAAVQAIRFDHPGDGSRLDYWIARLDGIAANHMSIDDDDIAYRVAQSAYICLNVRNPLHPECDRWKARALDLAQRGSPLGERSIAPYMVATEMLLDGRLSEAGNYLRGAPSPDTPGLDPVAANYGYVALAIECLYHGQFAKALDVVDQGLDYLRRCGVPIWTGQLAGVGVAAALGRGDMSDAERRLRDLAAHSNVSSGTLASYHRSLAARIAYSATRYADALGLAGESVILAEKAGWGWHECQAHMAGALAAMEAREFEAAQQHLDAVNRLMATGQGRVYRMHAHLAAARLSLLQENEGDADGYLKAAVEVGRRDGLVEFGLLNANVASELWARALMLGIEPDYVKRQIRLRGLQAPPDHDGEWPWPVRISTLGQFSVELDEVRLAFGGKTPRKPLELLQAIIALGARNVSRESLHAALWPDAEGDVADTSLRVTLSRLRKLLRHDDALLSADGKLGISERLCVVDTDTLERVLGQIEAPDNASLAKTEEFERLAGRLLALYRGGFLANERECAWMLPLRDRLRTRFILAVIGLGQKLETAGATRRAIELYGRALEQDNLAEPIYRRQILALKSIGQEAEALKAFRRCRDMLSIVLGVKPSAETELAAKC